MCVHAFRLLGCLNEMNYLATLFISPHVGLKWRRASFVSVQLVGKDCSNAIKMYMGSWW